MKNKNIVSLSLVLIFLASILIVITKPVENSRYTQSNNSGSSLTELKSEILVQGSGDRQVKVGDLIQVHYTGTLLNGTKFDSSKDRGTPFEFSVGEGVILGWSQGVIGMKKGETRKLSIPSSLGYGSMAIGSIPANSDLYFEIELLDFLN